RHAAEIEDPAALDGFESQVSRHLKPVLEQRDDGSSRGFYRTVAVRVQHHLGSLPTRQVALLEVEPAPALEHDTAERVTPPKPEKTSDACPKPSEWTSARQPTRGAGGRLVRHRALTASRLRTLVATRMDNHEEPGSMDALQDPAERRLDLARVD